MNSKYLNYRLCLLILLLAGSVASGQSTSRIYDRTVGYPGSIGLSNGDVLFFDKLDSVVLRVSPLGTVVWAKSLGTGLSVAGAAERSDGSLNLFLLKSVNGVSNDRYPAYARISAAGLPMGAMNVLNDITSVGSCDRMVRMGDGFSLLTPNGCAGQGPMHMVLSNGNVAWSQDLMFIQPWDMVQHSDGYLYGFWQRQIYKYDPNTGELVWQRAYFYLNSTHPPFVGIVSLPQGLALAFSQRPGGFGAPSYPAIALMDTAGTILSAMQWDTGTDGIGSIDFDASADRLILTAAMSTDRTVIFSCAHDLSAPSVHVIDFGSQSLATEASVNVDDGLNFTGFVSDFMYNGHLLHVRTDPAQDISQCHGVESYPVFPVTMDTTFILNGGILPYTETWAPEPFAVTDVTPVVEVHCLSTGQPQEPEPLVHLGPVPCDEVLSFRSALQTPATVTVIDVMGRNVLSQRIGPGQNGIDVSLLSSGTYILTLERDGSAAFALPFVVAH